MRAEARLGVLPQQGSEDVVQQRLEVTHGHVAVDAQAFELVEVRAVGGVRRVAPVHAAGRDNADRRSALEHRADLHGRSVGTKQVAFVGRLLRDIPEAGAGGEIESILLIARRVVGGRVEGIEAVILAFDLRAVGDGESRLAQDAAHFLPHERQRVAGAGPGVRRRQRGVDRRPEPRSEFAVADPGERGVEMLLQARLRLVDELAHGGSLLLRHRAHLLHEGGEFAVGADVPGLGGLKLGARAQRGEFGGGLGEEGVELVLHEETLGGSRKRTKGRTTEERGALQKKKDGIPRCGTRPPASGGRARPGLALRIRPWRRRPWPSTRPGPA